MLPYINLNNQYINLYLYHMLIIGLTNIYFILLYYIHFFILLYYIHFFILFIYKNIIKKNTKNYYIFKRFSSKKADLFTLLNILISNYHEYIK